MSRYRTEAPQSTDGSLQAESTAVLLINLGTPDAPTPSAVRRYLKEFLSDPRVVEIPRVVWWCILNGIILPFRSRASAKKYAKIWLPADAATQRPAESPLLRYSQAQADALQAQLPATVQVKLAMRYGNPSLQSALQSLREQGVGRILCMPLYPQFSATTTATAYDVLFTELARTRNQAAVRTVKDFYAHPAYIQALQAQVEGAWQKNGRPNFAAGEKLVLSFHGVPQRSVKLGDPYYSQCLQTGRLLGAALGLAEGEFIITFQSRFGKAEWLQPYTVVTLEALGKAGCTRADVFCPGFPADCLETLEEINMEVREEYERAGGKNYHYIPCMNDSPAWIAALDTITQENLQGWL